jgi:hypothetical protein
LYWAGLAFIGDINFTLSIVKDVQIVVNPKFYERDIFFYYYLILSIWFCKKQFSYRKQIEELEIGRTHNKGFAASVAGRKNNRRFYKAKLQFGQDKKLWSSNLNFNKTILISSGTGGRNSNTTPAASPDRKQQLTDRLHQSKQ